jgi:hypothetical protein
MSLVNEDQLPALTFEATREREGKIRSEVRSRRVWGYVFWGLMGVIIAVPELTGAFLDDYVPWPTISGTIGYLEYWHPLVALIVIVAIAWWALHVIEFGPEKRPVLGIDISANPEKRYVNTPGGWSTRAKQEPMVLSTRVGVIYIVIALLAVLIPSFAVGLAIRPDDEFLLGEVLYSAILIFWILIPLALAYVGKEVLWPTLFETFRDFAHLEPYKIIATVLAGAITVLLVHLVLYPWPSTIPDIQDLHKQYEGQRHQEKKQSEPSPFAP